MCLLCSKQSEIKHKTIPYYSKFMYVRYQNEEIPIKSDTCRHKHTHIQTHMRMKGMRRRHQMKTGIDRMPYTIVCLFAFLLLSQLFFHVNSLVTVFKF